MSTLTSIPVNDPKRFLSLQEGYKQSLMEDMRLEESSEVAARRQMLMENPNVPPEWKLPQVKAMTGKLNKLTKRIRQPFGGVGTAHDPITLEDMDENADDFAAGPVQALMKRIVKPAASPIKTPPNRPPLKRKADHLPPQITPSTRKAKKKAKQKLAFRGKQRPKPRPKAKGAAYRDDLGPPIPFNIEETATPKSAIKSAARSAGKSAAKSAGKSLKKRALDWIGWKTS